jgi:hypothetical protein
MTVLDALDASGDRLPDCMRRIGVHGYIGPPVFCGLDRGMQLRFGVFGGFDVAER